MCKLMVGKLLSLTFRLSVIFLNVEDTMWDALVSVIINRI